MQMVLKLLFAIVQSGGLHWYSETVLRSVDYAFRSVTLCAETRSDLPLLFNHACRHQTAALTMNIPTASSRSLTKASVDGCYATELDENGDGRTYIVRGLWVGHKRFGQVYRLL